MSGCFFLFKGLFISREIFQEAVAMYIFHMFLVIISEISTKQAFLFAFLNLVITILKMPPNPIKTDQYICWKRAYYLRSFKFNKQKLTSLWALLEKPFDNLHFLQNISQIIQSLWEYLWGTILMTRSGTFVYMHYASAVGLLPWECEMTPSRTAFSIVTSRRSARINNNDCIYM